jgi:hypothetical protein
MKCNIKYIIVVDNSDKQHYVKLSDGVNIITGKSSTGKSALIEIFDYCFGSSEYTVPVGVITNSAAIYCLVLMINKKSLVLARKPDDNKICLKEENEEFISDVNKFSLAYFDKCDFLTLPDFKVELARYFGLTITDTTDDDSIIQFTGKKKGRPSIRNIVSYILQHQNLVANKHALFYRFDEKQKRDQVIDQFKIFSGFVDQNYFILKSQLKDLERELKNLQIKKDKEEINIKSVREQIIYLLNEYNAVVGKPLFQEDIEQIFRYPKNRLQQLINISISIDYASNQYSDELNKLELQRDKLILEIRELESKFLNLSSSIDYANKYKDKSNSLFNVDVSFDESSTICPFCKSTHTMLINETNNLKSAIDWLNKELDKTPYFLDSFEEERKNINNEIMPKKQSLNSIVSKIKKLKDINEKLKQKQSLEYQAQNLIYKIASFFENYIEIYSSEVDKLIKENKKLIRSIKSQLKEKYNVESQIQNANLKINAKMNEIGENFDFEEAYKPINLNFEIETFNLYHQINNKRIPLRSMGSGANWLYCHLSLFLSLQAYFCSLGGKSIIPSFLFIDQPSQVYFPSIETDEEENFDASKLRKDVDIIAVTNMYNQFYKFCQKIEKETGIKPQLIVTDHADNLELDGVEFDSLVDNRRWRSRGFMDV